MVFCRLPLYGAHSMGRAASRKGRRLVRGIGEGMSGRVHESPKVVRAFDDLAAQERSKIEIFVTPFSSKAGAILFRQDMPQDRMYLLTSGRVELSTALFDRSRGLQVFATAGESLGESAAGDSPGYLSTARVVEDATGYEINLERFRELRLNYAPPAFKVLHRLALGLCSAIRHLDVEIGSRPAKLAAPAIPQDPGLSGRVHGLSQDCVGFLRRMPFFEAFTDQEINALCQSMRQWEVAKDQLLFSEGDAAASCFVLARGLVEVMVERGGRLFREGSRLSFKLLEAVHWNLLAVHRALLAERTCAGHRDTSWILI